MLVRFSTKVERFNFEVEFAPDEVPQLLSSTSELFVALAALGELVLEPCGICDGRATYHTARKSSDGDWMLSMRCGHCGAYLSFLKHKDGTGVFPKRSGEHISTHGWKGRTSPE